MNLVSSLLVDKTRQRDFESHIQHEGKQEALDVLSADETTWLNLDIPKATMRQLKIRAVEQDTSVSDIVRKLVSEYLSK